MTWTTDNIFGYRMSQSVGLVLDSTFACIIIAAAILTLFWIVYLSNRSYTAYKIYRRIKVTEYDSGDSSMLRTERRFRIDMWKFGFLAVIAAFELLTEALYLTERNFAAFIKKRNISSPTSTNCTTDSEMILLYESIWKVSYIFTFPVVSMLCFASLISFLTIFLFKAYSTEIWEFKRERRIFKLIIAQIVIVFLLCIFPYTFYLGIVLGLISSALHIGLYIRYSVKIYKYLRRQALDFKDSNDVERYVVYKRQTVILRNYKILSYIIQPVLTALLILFILAHLMTISHAISYSLCRSDTTLLKISNEQLQATRKVEQTLQLIFGAGTLLTYLLLVIPYSLFTILFILDNLLRNKLKKIKYRFTPGDDYRLKHLGTSLIQQSSLL